MRRSVSLITPSNERSPFLRTSRTSFSASGLLYPRLTKAETASSKSCDPPSVLALSCPGGARVANLSFNSTIIRSASFLPTPGIATRRTWSASFNARANSSAGDAGKNVDGELGSDSGHVDQQQEELFLLAVLKTEELERVLANVGVDLQAHRGADFRQAIKDVERNKDLIADSAHVDHRFAGDFLR